MIRKRGEMGQPVMKGTWYKKCTLVDHYLLYSVQLQLRAKQTAPLVERKDVSFILTIFPQNFWNK